MTFWAPWDPWMSPAADAGALLPHGSGSIVFVVVFCALVDFIKLLVELLGRNEDRHFTSDPSLVTAVIASRNGATRLPMTVSELRRAIPPERILVVDDASTDDTCQVAEGLGCHVHRFAKRKGKAAAINYAVHRVQTPLTLLLDDDTRMGGACIPTSLLVDDGYDAAAFSVLPDRRDRDGARGSTFLGALQRYEYGKSMEIGKRFHDVTESVACVSGAVGLYRTRDLDRLHHQHTGVFQAEDLQRTMIHLLHRHRIVFVSQPVWTVAPASWGQWLRQRMTGWYPGLYHQVANFIRVLFRPGSSWRLRYEMLYNIYTAVSDPLKVWSIAVILLTPALRWWGIVIYLTYLAFEIYPYWVIRIPGDRRHAPVAVLLLYPIYGAVNTVLRTASLATWFWFRYVTGSMRPRRGPGDRIE